jgi:hypothetical protein
MKMLSHVNVGAAHVPSRLADAAPAKDTVKVEMEIGDRRAAVRSD